MDKRKLPSDKNTMNPKKKRLIITLEQKFDVIERHECGHSKEKTVQSPLLKYCERQ
jgi:hypothetical protein